MKRALITGISGFVGGYLGEQLLSEGWELHGTCFGDGDRVRKGLRCVLHEMNLCDEKNVRQVIANVKPDCVFHLAAQSSAALSWKKPRLTMDINLGGAINLLEAVRECCPDCSLLLIGSSEEYGAISAHTPKVDENYPLNPTNPYAVSKMAQERLGALYAKAYGMKIMMTRAFNHIGPGQSEQFVVPSFARQIAGIEKGLQPPVLKVGNLQAKRDFTDVRDVVRAYTALSRQGTPGESYNIGSGCSHSIQSILDRLIALSSAKVRIETDPERLRPSDTPEIVCDSSKLAQATGWTPVIPLEQSLKDILAYYRNQ